MFYLVQNKYQIEMEYTFVQFYNAVVILQYLFHWFFAMGSKTPPTPVTGDQLPDLWTAVPIADFYCTITSIWTII